MASSIPSPDEQPQRIPRWLETRRRRVTAGGVAVLVAVLVAAGIVIALTDPFGPSTPSSNGVADNEYPTSTTTVSQGTLSSQTSVSATLGYAGSYTIAIPSGTAASDVTQNLQSVTADEAKVTNDETALANSEASSKPSNASTLLSAEATVSSDEAGLNAAKTQLIADQRLGCPASSSSTVTSAVGGSSSPSSDSPSSSAGSPSSTGGSSSPSSSGSTPAGNTGSAKAHFTADIAQGAGNTGSAPSAPSATTGSVDGTTNSASTVMGTVNPGGSDTTYDFQYGTSPNYGETTSTLDAGSGSSDVAVSVTLSGLSSGATYHYRLVAKNALGTDYGQDGTFTTNAAPVATTGSATTVSATSESLAGTVDPNGVDTSYHFEWGTSAAFGHTTPTTDAGAGATTSSVSASLTGLKPGKTYEFALVATSALGTSTGLTTTFQTAESSCVAERLVVSSDEAALTEAKDALSVDRLGAGSSVTSAEQTLSSDEASLASAREALTEAQAQAANPNTTFTSLPAAGKVISRGKTVYALAGEPVPLFYGSTTLYRALYLGVSDGPDVAELQQNLIALGFGGGITASNHFSPATETAVKAWQASIGVPATGVVALGDVVVESGPIEVDTVSPMVGGTASAGTSVLTATSTIREVTISLNASQQSEVKVGDAVTVTLPDNSTTPGVVSSVGRVATTPSSSGSPAGNTGGSSPTITVEVTLTDPKATGNLDEAPVEVAITNASVANALYVPVDALLALSSGGYALEEVEANGSHQLVAVSLGLFDDADGFVQVSGPGVQAGQKIVIPNT